jgi:hypothetical protein
MNRPSLTVEQAKAIMVGSGVKDAPIILLGLRYPTRRIFNDPMFIVLKDKVIGFNGNTDPNGARPGHGFSEATKGMAMLKCGLWHYKQGMHRQSYMALVQAAPVTVLRDADEQVQGSVLVYVDGMKFYEHTGDFGIHIHKGGENSTSSLGCQTIFAKQWDEYFGIVQAEMKKAGLHEIQYVLRRGA